MNESGVSYHSHHYFIGKRLKKSDSTKIKNTQDNILRNNDFLNSDHKINNIYSPFIYLGYFREDLESKIKNLTMPLFFALGEQLSSLRIYINGYTLSSQSSQFKYLALNYEDKNGLIEKVIIPYLKKNFDTYTGVNLTYEKTPIIPLFRLNNKEQKQFLAKNKNTKREIDNKIYDFFTDIKLPQAKFDKSVEKKYYDLDSIELLRATPVKVKKGKKSFNEQLQIDTLFSIPLGGNLY